MNDHGKAKRIKELHILGLNLLLVGYLLMVAMSLVASMTDAYYADEQPATIGITIGAWDDEGNNVHTDGGMGE